jgi:hypothetical protein
MITMKKEKQFSSESIEIVIPRDTLKRIRVIASGAALSEGSVSEALLRLGLEAYTLEAGRPGGEDKDGRTIGVKVKNSNDKK